MKLFFGAGALLFIPVERGLIDVTLAIDLFGPRLRWKIAWHFLKIYIQTIYYRVYQRFRLIKRDNNFQVIFKHVVIFEAAWALAKIGSNLKSTGITKLSLSKSLTHAVFIDFPNRVGLKSRTVSMFIWKNVGKLSYFSKQTKLEIKMACLIWNL